MLISFTCERCGKYFRLDDRYQGRRGRCSRCGHVMRIPVLAERVGADDATSSAPGDEAPRAREAESSPAPEAPAFRLSPPESRPQVRRELLEHPEPAAADEANVQPAVGPHNSLFALASPVHRGYDRHMGEHHVGFELLDDDSDAAPAMTVSPEIARGLRELADFEKDRSGYKVEGERHGFFFRLEHSRPAGWFYRKWRAAVGFVLKILRWIDTWAYLISVPFVMLMIFGIVVENRGFVHTGAVLVVLANYGRFWADLLAFFVRPYKDGPLQGVAFLFPPYTIYYLTAHWKHMKPILRRIATSCIPIVLVVLAYAFLPSVNPEIKEIDGVAAKIEAGEKKLESEVKSELEKAEGEVRTLRLPKELTQKFKVLTPKP
jgi:hypothetical protein